MKGRQAVVLIVCGVMLSPILARAAAGLSDIAATEACWIRPPYALVKCQSEGGRYHARLIRARPETPEEKSSWSLIPAGYEGIVPIETVVSDVDQVAITTRFLVVQNSAGAFEVLDMDKAAGVPQRFATLAKANDALVGGGVERVSEGDFQPFEVVYREYRPRSWSLLVLFLLAVLAVGGVGVLVLRRRRSHLRGRLAD